MSKLNEKLIDAYTILLMAEEIEESEIPETVVESGKTLREEVILEKARRTTGTVPEPVDKKIISRLSELEATLDILLGGE